MQNLKNLIVDLKNEAKSEWAIAEDMSDMYLSDANDAQVIFNFITEHDAANIPTAAKYLDTRDTCIRERICMAIAADKGNYFLIENFGWSVA